MDRPAHQPPEADPDAAVLARVAAGDGGAFESLVWRHQDRLLALCERLLGDREDARDAAQEVFLKAFRKAATFRPEARVSTWLYRIAVNHCLNRLRRHKVVRFLSFGAFERSGEGAGPSEASAGLDPPDGAPGPEAELEARRRWRATRRTIGELPESQRAVLVLARFEGLSYKEIAQVLGITVGAVESRLFRAMRRLEQAQENAGPRVS